MARPAKFSHDQILDHCLRVANTDGAPAVSVSSIARSLGAPSGSIYHRFPSRDLLIASLWLRCVERFQQGFLDALNHPDPMEAAVAAARHTITWSRANPDDAQLLMVHHWRDLLSDGWPEEVAARNQAQIERVTEAMEVLTSRLAASEDRTERTVFAVLHLPMGAVRSALAQSQAPTELSEKLTIEAVRAVLAPLKPNQEDLK